MQKSEWYALLSIGASLTSIEAPRWLRTRLGLPFLRSMPHREAGRKDAVELLESALALRGSA
jgi:hypothetical protein